MRRVEPDRGQDRFEFPVEEVAKPGFLVGVPLGALQEPDALGVEQRKQHIVQDAVLVVDHVVGYGGDALELLGRGQVVGSALRGTDLFLLLEPRDPDFEELVEDRPDDAQETQPLE